MKFINHCDIERGQIIPSAWISFGKHHLGGPYLCFCLPLFLLANMYYLETNTHKFGWYVPSFRFVFGYRSVVIAWYWMFHSNCMDDQTQC